jgi:hypothetical protein
MFAILAVLMTATIAVFPVFAGTSDINSGNGLESSIITSVPRTMSYQGILKDSGGDPAVDSVYSVTFRMPKAAAHPNGRRYCPAQHRRGILQRYLAM